jgi:glycosyltransferase involved in cell wall biosynthesis
MKVSIVTVCYNAEKYIRSAIESVISQSYNDIEYIVIDGASSDATIDIVNDNTGKNV